MENVSQGTEQHGTGLERISQPIEPILDPAVLAAASANPRWEALKDILRLRFAPGIYAAWVLQMSCLDDDGRVLRLALPNLFSLNWVNDHYRPVLQEALSSLGPIELDLVVREAMPSSGTTAAVEPPAAPAVASAPASEEVPAASESKPPHASDVVRGPYNPRYTFGTFVTGSSNELAFSAAKQVADGMVYCPLVIVGGVGLGKTHLLHAIAHGMLKRKPNARIHFRTSESFTIDVTQGIRNNRMDEVRKAYRSCDVLLIDDIQLLSGREACQEEFFHTFNVLHDAQKTIVVTSDRLPHEVPNLEERVRTRFEWGLIADLKIPELETRVAILKRKAADDNVELPDDVAMLIAQSVRSNVRELEGCLIRVMAWSNLRKQPITIQVARDALMGIVSDKARALTADAIVKAVAEYFGLKPADLKGQSRTQAVAYPRQVAMYLCRRHTSASSTDVGQALGGKDHTTVLNAVNKIKERMSSPEVRTQIEELERLLLE